MHWSSGTGPALWDTSGEKLTTAGSGSAAPHLLMVLTLTLTLALTLILFTYWGPKEPARAGVVAGTAQQNRHL